ncbi:YgaP family membrane protein [Neobacillus drentensis]|uniref:YgaP family membrane protein n=1 Tax=Neobacillus drentensis TaxID=220684 RepID=UPI0030023022
MNVKPNISIFNALIRITLGLTILSWTTSKLVKQPWRDSYLFVAMCGAMKVAEGIVRFCPLTAIFEKCQCMISEHDRAMDSMNGMEGLTNKDHEEMLPYNPT